MFDGRLARLPYFLRSFVASAIGVASKLAAFDEYGETTRYAALHLIVAIAVLVLLASFTVKRLHDLGRPGRHYWLAYVPIYNIYFGLQLLFQEGAAAVAALPVVESTPRAEGQRSASVASCNGEGVDVYCGQCGVESPANAKFCWQCGAILYGAIRDRTRAQPVIAADISEDPATAQPSTTPIVHGAQHDARGDAECCGLAGRSAPAVPAEALDASNGRAHEMNVSSPTQDATSGSDVDEEELARTDRHWLIAIALFCLMVAMLAIPFCHRAGDA